MVGLTIAGLLVWTYPPHGEEWAGAAVVLLLPGALVLMFLLRPPRFNPAATLVVSPGVIAVRYADGSERKIRVTALDRPLLLAETSTLLPPLTGSMMGPLQQQLVQLLSRLTRIPNGLPWRYWLAQAGSPGTIVPIPVEAGPAILGELVRSGLMPSRRHGTIPFTGGAFATLTTGCTGAPPLGSSPLGSQQWPAAVPQTAIDPRSPTDGFG